MARISDMDGRTDGAYTRLFGDSKRGHLVSQAHAATIRAGDELEKFIASLVPKRDRNSLTNIAKGRFINGVKEIVYKPKKPKSGEAQAIESDFAIFHHNKFNFTVVELKLGDTFDTQKSLATKQSLQAIVDYIHNGVMGYKGRFNVCSFSALSRESIVAGFKGEFTLDQVMTGQELCFHLGIDYEEVLQHWKEHQDQNREYFDAMTDHIKSGIEDERYFGIAEEQKNGQLKLWGGSNGQ